ncbi:biopolymer transporter ExbD [Endozoicomonas sp. SM1973]|uniref:Biopolymer transporter ExbD n=1 Tax=Spartinivicinus marinus TaxID=2994442 RepID=A0A853I3V9_9GAMM|nr:biopolymer transporter ExbD [Spartinivicinus marinus]MCX4026335.1 biopolymer transporter ExbD [Spartinivicinus marinus]NYZ67319.1 biopolymer transporter ExbD [Spartinivicinus marinus]
MIQFSNEDDQSSGSFLPDLTSLLDVLFIVLVFFLLTANSAQLLLPIDLPAAASESLEPQKKPNPIEIAVLKDGTGWQIESATFTEWDELTKVLDGKLQQNKLDKVTVAADKQAQAEQLLKLLAYLQENEIAVADIIMQRE